MRTGTTWRICVRAESGVGVGGRGDGDEDGQGQTAKAGLVKSSPSLVQREEWVRESESERVKDGRRVSDKSEQREMKAGDSGCS